MAPLVEASLKPDADDRRTFQNVPLFIYITQWHKSRCTVFLVERNPSALHPMGGFERAFQAPEGLNPNDRE